MLFAGWETKKQCPLKGVEGGWLLFWGRGRFSTQILTIHTEVRDRDGGNGMVSWRVIARTMVPNPVSCRDQGLRGPQWCTERGGTREEGTLQKTEQESHQF